jgi:uncharacterized protein (UPF0332 family)
VKPEGADYLEKARHCLLGAKTIAAAGISDVAAREAYFAAFHAAEGYVFECTDKAVKTHRGVRSLFNRLGRYPSCQRTRIKPNATARVYEQNRNSIY